MFNNIRIFIHKDKIIKLHKPVRIQKYNLFSIFFSFTKKFYIFIFYFILYLSRYMYTYYVITFSYVIRTILNIILKR